jgi:hypothetical protein
MLESSDEEQDKVVERPVGKKARKKIVESSDDEDVEAGADGSRDGGGRRVRPFVGLPAFSSLAPTLRQRAQAAGAVGAAPGGGAAAGRALPLPRVLAEEDEEQPVLVSVSLHLGCAQQVRQSRTEKKHMEMTKNKKIKKK